MLTFESLLESCSPGGASVLTSVTELRPAAGEHASITPAKFVDGRNSVFAFETRFVDGQAARAVLIDSKQSSINRGENAISQAIRDGHEVLSKMPRILVDYGDGLELTDLDLPHRFADGHIRAGSIDGKPATENGIYRSIRNATPQDARSLLNNAPASLLYGAWDSTRKSNQVRLRSALVGETIGVLADQEKSGEEQQSLRGGARVDPVAASVKLDGPTMNKLATAQETELSNNNLVKIHESIKKAKKGTVSAAGLGLGALPPSLNALGGVSCQRIIRSWVLSFASIRQLRFGPDLEATVAARALIAALGLATIARAEAELYLRANCDLVEADKPVVKLDKRHGVLEQLPPLTIEHADSLLTEALRYAQNVEIANWDGRILRVTGNPDILGGATEESED